MISNLLNKMAELPSEMRETTIKTMLDNMHDLSSDQKNTLLQSLLKNLDDDNDEKDSSKKSKKTSELKSELIKEILKNSKNLDETQRAQILRDAMEKARVGKGETGDAIMQELVAQIETLPDSV